MYVDGEWGWVYYYTTETSGKAISLYNRHNITKERNILLPRKKI